MTSPRSTRIGIARKSSAALLGLVGTVVWTHSLTGVLRAVAGLGVEDVACAGVGLTVAAIAAALAGAFAYPSSLRAAVTSGITALAGAGVISVACPDLLVSALASSVLALVSAGVAFGAIGAWFAARLPASLDELPARHPKKSVAWVGLALLAVVQVGRLATYMTDGQTDWFLSTRHPFYAKHECANAYVYGAELARRGETNVYDPAHYPGLNPEAAPETEMVGMVPEDPFQYPPQFLLLPRLAIAVTNDYGAVRLLWFGLNLTLCLAAVLALAGWVGGRVGTAAGLLTPGLLIAFPVLHDFQYGQFHFAAIALTVLGLLAFGRRRLAVGGALLAAAILAKLFPAVLLVPLAVQRRWCELGWTAAAGAVATAVALLVFGTAPFTAFAEFHLPRLADGSAFAFGEAWPEVASLLTAGNQGIHGIVHKLGAMGVPGADGALAGVAGKLYAAGLLGLALFAGLRSSGMGRAHLAVTGLGLLGLGSLASSGAWADYVPLTCVWLLAYLFPLASARPRLQAALAVCAVMQVSLLGAVPLGSWSDASWMMPLSLAGAILMLSTFAAAVYVPAHAAARSGGEERERPVSLAAPTRG